MPHPLLFQPARLGPLTVKNRLVMPAMVRNYADAQGCVTQRYIDHIERVARGGVGTIILEASSVSPEGKAFVNQLGIHGDAHVPGLARLVAAAHAHGARIGIQLSHAGRQAPSRISGAPPLAPSAIPDPLVGEPPRALSIGDIERLVQAFDEAAGRAERAGFDFVELDAAHGNLIAQFLSPFSNKREDAYGGSLENRLQFLEEAYFAVRTSVGADYPILVRLSADERLVGGLTLRETRAIARRLARAGVDALDIAVGTYASYDRGDMIPPMAKEDGALVGYAAAIKRVVKIPVIGGGKLRAPALAESVLRDDAVDFVALGRPLLADPDWPTKAARGRARDILPCIACNQACIGRLVEQKDVGCTVNPETGREALFTRPRRARRRVLVIGGGPAGLTAAKTAAERGDEVVLYEKAARLGGQLLPAAKPPLRPGWAELRRALIAAVTRLGVDVRLKTEFTPQTHVEKPYDLAVIAVGSKPNRPGIPGVDRTLVTIGRDLLEGRVRVRGRVVVAGGGCMGAQTAEYLAAQGHAVSLVEAGGTVAYEAPPDDRTLLLQRLAKQRVKLFTHTRILGIGPQSVVVEDGMGSRSLKADTVVVCLGAHPADGLAGDLQAIARRIVVVGDAREPRRATEAIMEGALAVLEE